MGVVIKVVILGSLLLAIFSLIPPLAVAIGSQFDLAFSTELVDAMETVYEIIPAGLRQRILALFSAVVISILLKWTIGATRK